LVAMSEKEKTPSLLDFLYGEVAELARRTVSWRLLAWDAAVEGWLAKTKKQSSIIEYRRAKRVLGDFFGLSSKPPWEATEADVQAYVDWRKADGKAASTIRNDLNKLVSFFGWCGEAEIDPATGPDFNPARGIHKPRDRDYSHARCLSPEEAQALLEAYLLEGSNLSLRDHAYALTRTRLGRPFKDIQQLQWGQLESDEGGSHWARWKDGERERLDEDVFAAIHDYLRKSGRLETIRPEAYVFCPIKHGREKGNAAEDWLDSKFLRSVDLWKPLKKFGLAVGIPPEKLNSQALRHTAVMRRWEAGANVEEMQAFLGGRSSRETRDYLRDLPRVSDERTKEGQPKAEDLQALRRIRRAKPWENMTHGDGVKNQPPEQLVAILDEEASGLDDEMQGLLVLSEHLAERLERADSYAEQEALSRPLAKASTRLMEMQATRRELKKKSEAESILENLDALYAKFVAQGIIDPEETFEGPEVADKTTQEEALKKSIAIVRLVLRRSFCIAMESKDPMDAARAADKYVECCGRLARLLMLEKRSAEDGLEGVRQAFDWALEVVMKEKNIHL
jgi:hypothetical protein